MKDFHNNLTPEKTLSNRDYMTIIGDFSNWCCIHHIDEEYLTDMHVEKYMLDAKRIGNYDDSTIIAAIYKYRSYIYAQDFNEVK